jgi:hypothetical protein
MGVSALWTASHFEIPVMIVVADNRSYYNDEMHQERVAQMRSPAQNRWIGQRIDDPRVVWSPWRGLKVLPAKSRLDG